MISVGNHVIWNSGKNLEEGIIVDYYKFKTRKYNDNYNKAVLIKCLDGTHVLKLENEIKYIKNEARRRKF